MKQTTLRKEIRCSGIGLHSGQRVEMVLRPAVANTGIVFNLPGVKGRERVSPKPERVVATGLATTLGSGTAHVSTVEHLLGAFSGLEIDNAYVDVVGQEIPILDGSASAYVYLINSAGVRHLEATRRITKITAPLTYERDGKRISARPFHGLQIDYAISFSHPMIGDQCFRYTSTPANFESQIARARTFGFLRDVEYLQRNGLALGGTLENAIVFDEYGVINPEGLRFDDEMVRHKILDFMGDIAMSRYRIWGHFEVACSGHDFNNQFMRYLFEHASEYLETVPLDTQASSVRIPDDACVGVGLPAWI